MRGEIYELTRPRDAVGHEQRGARYAVVVQATALSALSTWIVCPTSTSASPSPLRPVIDLGGTPTMVLVDQMAAVSTAGRLGRQVGYLPAGGPEMIAIDRALRTVLAL